MDKKCRSAVYAGLEQPHTLFGSAPAFDDYIIKFLAQKLVDYGLIFRIDFEEIG
jgi:hypothetical protein